MCPFLMGQTYSSRRGMVIIGTGLMYLAGWWQYQLNAASSLLISSVSQLTFPQSHSTREARAKEEEVGCEAPKIVRLDPR